MSYRHLPEGLVDVIHDECLNPGELAGRAGDKSLAGALSRVENRIAYGLIEDVFDLAAAYAIVLATGHVFNDANKRTAYRAMLVSLDLHAIRIDHNPIEIGDLIREAAQGRLDEAGLAEWLRAHAI